MTCKKCGREIRDDSNFCEFCGAKIEKKVTKKKHIIVAVFVCIAAATCGAFFVVSGIFENSDVNETAPVNTDYSVVINAEQNEDATDTATSDAIGKIITDQEVSDGKGSDVTNKSKGNKSETTNTVNSKTEQEKTYVDTAENTEESIPEDSEEVTQDNSSVKSQHDVQQTKNEYEKAQVHSDTGLKADAHFSYNSKGYTNLTFAVPDELIGKNYCLLYYDSNGNFQQFGRTGPFFKGMTSIDLPNIFTSGCIMKGLYFVDYDQYFDSSHTVDLLLSLGDIIIQCNESSEKITTDISVTRDGSDFTPHFKNITDDSVYLFSIHWSQGYFSMGYYTKKDISHSVSAKGRNNIDNGDIVDSYGLIRFSDIVISEDGKKLEYTRNVIADGAPISDVLANNNADTGIIEEKSDTTESSAYFSGININLTLPDSCVGKYLSFVSYDKNHKLKRIPCSFTPDSNQISFSILNYPEYLDPGDYYGIYVVEHDEFFSEYDNSTILASYEDISFKFTEIHSGSDATVEITETDDKISLKINNYDPGNRYCFSMRGDHIGNTWTFSGEYFEREKKYYSGKDYTYYDFYEYSDIKISQNKKFIQYVCNIINENTPYDFDF